MQVDRWIKLVHKFNRNKEETENQSSSMGNFISSMNYHDTTSHVNLDSLKSTKKPKWSRKNGGRKIGNIKQKL